MFLWRQEQDWIETVSPRERERSFLPFPFFLFPLCWLLLSRRSVLVVVEGKAREGRKAKKKKEKQSVRHFVIFMEQQRNWCFFWHKDGKKREAFFWYSTPLITWRGYYYHLRTTETADYAEVWRKMCGFHCTKRTRGEERKAFAPPNFSARTQDSIRSIQPGNDCQRPIFWRQKKMR